MDLDKISLFAFEYDIGTTYYMSGHIREGNKMVHML